MIVRFRRIGVLGTLLFVVCALSTQVLTAQAQGATRADSTGIPYPYAAFIAQVMADHPVARQADLLAEDVRNQLRTAWGAFDPTITANWDQKRFSGTNYYA